MMTYLTSGSFCVVPVCPFIKYLPAVWDSIVIWVQVQAVCTICCLCCCLITEATGCSKYFKMLLENGEDMYTKTLIHTKSYVTVYFTEIISWFWVRRKSCCIKTFKKNLLSASYFTDETFLSVFFSLHIIYAVILLLPHVAQGKAI